MNCTTCQASLAPASTRCFFCGTDLSAGRAGQAATANLSLRYRGGPTESEGWRIWLSWMLFGLYAPVVGNYLFEREEWSASLRADNLPPVAPSQRGLFVLAIVLFAPLIAILCLSWTVQSMEVAAHSHYRSVTESIMVLGLINLAISAIPAFGVANARWLNRRYEALITETTGADPLALVRFRSGTRGRLLAKVAAFSSLLLVSLQLIGLVADLGARGSMVTPFYMLSLLLSPWASSWLNIESTMRFRRVMAGTP